MAVRKIVTIGAGSVGTAAAAAMALRQLGDIFLYDIVEGLPQGRAMDINQASPSLHTDCRVMGTNSLDVLERSDIVVVTAGTARQAGMSRLDLLKQNLGVVREICSRIMECCPKAKVLLVTNPVDVLTWHVKRALPGLDVFGLGCSLDALRFRYFMAEAAGVSADSCQGMVIGTHSDVMIPLISHASIGGLPLKDVLDLKLIESIVTRTKEAGTAIVAKLRNHSGFYAAGHTAAQIVESIAFNRREVFPLSVMCRGEYGYRDIVLALPSIVGTDGAGRIIEIGLDRKEQAMLQACASSMRETISDAA